MLFANAVADSFGQFIMTIMLFGVVIALCCKKFLASNPEIKTAAKAAAAKKVISVITKTLR